MTAFKLGLVGAGRMGRNHMKALSTSDQVVVTAIAEPAEAVRASLPKSDTALHADLDSMLDAGGLDGVLVCAPSDMHLATVRKLVAAKLPILCEKPLGVVPSEAKEAARLAADASLPLQIGFWRRFVPMLMRLKQRIDAGELGDLYAIACFQWDGQPPSAYFRTHAGGIFVDMGVHEFDQARWLSGQDFVSTTSLASGVAEEPWPGDPESAHALATLSQGTTAVISLGRRFPLGDVCKVEVFGTKDWEECRFLWPPTADDTFLEALKVQAESFARYARGGPREGAGGDDAVAALEASHRAASAMAGEGRA